MGFGKGDNKQTYRDLQPYPLDEVAVHDMQILICERSETVEEAAETMRMLGVHPDNPVVITLEGIPK